MHRSSFMVFGAALVASAAIASAAQADDASCRANFTKSGNIMFGYKYTSYDVLPDVSPKTAFRKAYVNLANDGWKIGSSNEDVGVISAYEEVQSSEGRTAPFSVQVEPAEHGSKVTMTFSMGGGVIPIGRKPIDTLCGAISALKS